MLPEKSGEKIPEKLKRCSQSKKSTPAVGVTGDGSEELMLERAILQRILEC